MTMDVLIKKFADDSDSNEGYVVRHTASRTAKLSQADRTDERLVASDPLVTSSFGWFGFWK